MQLDTLIAEQSAKETSRCETVTSNTQIAALNRAFNRINTTAAQQPDSAQYNGKSMTVEQAAGLRALLNEFQFVVESSGEHPDVEINAQFNNCQSRLSVLSRTLELTMYAFMHQ